MDKSSSRKSLTVPGFKFSGISAGIKKTGRKDLALIYSEDTAVIAGVFTTNKIKAAPVLLNTKQMERSKNGQAIIINSGNANACTGLQGMRDAQEISGMTAKELGIKKGYVYVSSTGIIGNPLPMHKIRKAIPGAVIKLSPNALQDAASAIMTTDTFAKIFSKRIRMNGKTGTIAGIAKGAGMICPHMATMLSFIVTDIAVEPGALDTSLREAVNKSFNRLSVDNDMSTNDSVMILANGRLGNTPVSRKSPFYAKFNKALNEVTHQLSKMIALDGEGATKLIEVIVRGAGTEPDAEKVARAVAHSLLVKTAVYGKSPNWGRIMAAIGSSGAPVKEQNIRIQLNNRTLVNKGVGTSAGKNLKNLFSKKEITITVHLGPGKKEARVLTCDLTEKYVTINADYMT
jgi:glutamate N-acetyltransferase/amino-acid N-acetyltransferase